MALMTTCSSNSYLQTPTRSSPKHHHHHLLLPTSLRASTLTTHARKGLSSRTRRKDRTTPKQPQKENEEEVGEYEVVVEGEMFEVSTEPMPKLEGLDPDLLEGPQWDALGFVVQYLWAFGILFALIACGIAVATYNEGATDFKKTPVYKESIQSRELLEQPDTSSSDVFEGNPTEVAPSLE